MRRWLNCLFFLCYCAAGQAQWSRHYTDADGLPQNSVKQIAGGADGFIWMTTEDGVSRFDGKNFLNFSNHNRALASGRFDHIIPKGLNGELYASNDRREFLRLQQGMASPDSGFVNAVQKELSFLHLAKQPEVYYGSIRGKTAEYITDTTVVYHHPDAVFVLTPNTLSFYNNKKWLYTLPVDSLEKTRLFLLQDQLYYLHVDGILDVYGKNGWARTTITGGIFSGSDNYKNIRVYWNCNDSKGVLLVYNHSFYYAQIREDAGLVATRILNGFDIYSNEIISAFFDLPSSTLYLGSHVNGLYVFPPSLFRVVLAPSVESGHAYYAQVAVGAGELLTAQGHLYRRQETSPQAIFESPIATSDKYSMAVDSAGAIWTKRDSFLFRFSKGRYALSNTIKLPGPILSLLVAPDQLLYIGLDNGKLFSLDPYVSGASPHLLTQLPAAITYLAKAAQPVIWLATTKGLYRHTINTSRLDSVEGLKGKHVRSIYLEGDRVWVSTYGSGFYLYENDVLTSFPADRNQYLLTSHCMMKDRKGFFWISTNKGLFQVKEADLLAYAAAETRYIYYQYYSKSEGLATNEFNGGCQPCAVSMQDGWFSFPTINGLVWFNPDSLQPDLPDKPLFIDRIVVDNKDVELADIFRFSRDMKQVKVYLSTPYGGNPVNVRMQYALVKDGEEPAWLPVSEDHIISLSTIPSGKYTLRMRKFNGFGVNNFSEKIIAIAVPLPWYNHPLNLLLGIGLLIVLALLFARLRTNYIRKQNSMLEMRIADQTSELRHALDDLKLSQLELAERAELQQRMLAVFSHDIKAPMKYLMITAEKIHSGLLQEGNHSFAEASKAVKDHISRLYYLMDNILQYIKTQIAGNEVRFETVDLQTLVKEKLNLYQDIAAQSQTVLKNEVGNGLKVNSNKILLSVVLHNLIDNAVKVTEGGLITISARAEEGRVVVDVADSGIGIGPELLHWINNAGDGKQGIRPGETEVSGIGLRIVKDLVKLLGIELKAESAKGKTVFSLRIEAA